MDECRSGKAFARMARSGLSNPHLCVWNNFFRRCGALEVASASRLPMLNTLISYRGSIKDRWCPYFWLSEQVYLGSVSSCDGPALQTKNPLEAYFSRVKLLPMSSERSNVRSFHLKATQCHCNAEKIVNNLPDFKTSNLL